MIKPKNGRVAHFGFSKYLKDITERKILLENVICEYSSNKHYKVIEYIDEVKKELDCLNKRIELVSYEYKGE